MLIDHRRWSPSSGRDSFTAGQCLRRHRDDIWIADTEYHLTDRTHKFAKDADLSLPQTLPLPNLHDEPYPIEQPVRAPHDGSNYLLCHSTDAFPTTTTSRPSDGRSATPLGSARILMAPGPCPVEQESESPPPEGVWLGLDERNPCIPIPPESA